MKPKKNQALIWDLDKELAAAEQSGILTREQMTPFWDDPEVFESMLDRLVDEVDRRELTVEYHRLEQTAGGSGRELAERGNPTAIYLGELQQLEASTREDEILLAKEIELARRRLSRVIVRLAEESDRAALAKEFRKIVEQEGGIRLHFDPVQQHFSLDVELPLEEAAEWIQGLSDHASKALHRAYEDLQALKGDMIRSNLYLVLVNARRYRNKGLPFMDLIQEGNTGLLRAVEKYDWRRGFRFQTYASWWIIEAIKRALYNQARLIRVPIYLSQKLDKEGRNQDPSEDAKKELESSERGLPTDVPGYHRRVFSLDQVSDRYDDLSMVDMLEDKKSRDPLESLHEESLKDKINVVLKTLTDRERKILELRYGLNDQRPHTLEEISRKFHVSRERIRQIQQKSLRKLQSPLKFDEFADLVIGSE
ncbi:MAG: RNA polymerase sigma factor RpoD/SigA [Planctomycetota bacterium]